MVSVDWFGPTGSQGLDIKMYHYLYFSNLFGAVDLVRDYSKALGEAADLEETIKRGFANADDYLYARELRNAIVHRGFDPATAGHAQDKMLFILCPPAVQDRAGKKSYGCSFTYTVQLAEYCSRIVNGAIFTFMESHGFFEPGKFTLTKEDTLEAVKASTAMPDWAKAMAEQAFANIDFPQMAAAMEATRIKNLKKLLGQG
jgi:hypothetical protein